MAYRLLDTNIVSYMVKSHPLLAVYRPHITGYDLAVSFQSIAELLAGGVLAGWGQARWAALDAVLATLTVLQSDEVVCERWAEVWVSRRTQPIGIADCWIAATALAHGLDLITHNPADSVGIPGLVIITECP
jgi:tRNA(fMet)-specific endonuclease VapC